MYILFAGENYYPRGGMDDYKGTYSTVQDAEEAARHSGYDWWHVASGTAVVASGCKEYKR